MSAALSAGMTMHRSPLLLALTATLLACSPGEQEEGRGSTQSSVTEIEYRCVPPKTDGTPTTKAIHILDSPSVDPDPDPDPRYPTSYTPLPPSELQRLEDSAWVKVKECSFCGTDAETKAGECGEDKVLRDFDARRYYGGGGGGGGGG